MTMTQTIMGILDGAAYLPQGDNQGLADYHKAQAVKAALRRRNPDEKLSRVREALNQYRVASWLVDGRIRLVRDGHSVITFK